MVEREKESVQVKARDRVYFFDLAATEGGKNYLRITESRKIPDSDDWERKSIFLFPENAEKFASALNEMVERMQSSQSE